MSAGVMANTATVDTKDEKPSPLVNAWQKACVATDEHYAARGKPLPPPSDLFKRFMAAENIGDISLTFKEELAAWYAIAKPEDVCRLMLRIFSTTFPHTYDSQPKRRKYYLYADGKVITVWREILLHPRISPYVCQVEDHYGEIMGIGVGFISFPPKLPRKVLEGIMACTENGEATREELMTSIKKDPDNAKNYLNDYVQHFIAEGKQFQAKRATRNGETLMKMRNRERVNDMKDKKFAEDVLATTDSAGAIFDYNERMESYKDVKEWTPVLDDVLDRAIKRLASKTQIRDPPLPEINWEECKFLAQFDQCKLNWDLFKNPALQGLPKLTGVFNEEAFLYLTEKEHLAHHTSRDLITRDSPFIFVITRLTGNNLLNYKECVKSLHAYCGVDFDLTNSYITGSSIAFAAGQSRSTRFSHAWGLRSCIMYLLQSQKALLPDVWNIVHAYLVCEHILELSYPNVCTLCPSGDDIGGTDWNASNQTKGTKLSWFINRAEALDHYPNAYFIGEKIGEGKSVTFGVDSFKVDAEVEQDIPAEKDDADVAAIKIKFDQEVEYKLESGADIDIVVDVKTEAEFDTEAKKHLATVKTMWPDVGLEKEIKPSGSHMCVITRPKTAVYSPTFRQVQIYRGTAMTCMAHHLPCVRGCFGGPKRELIVAASLILCVKSSQEYRDLHFFAGRKCFAHDVLAKYHQRGYKMHYMLASPVAALFDKFIELSPRVKKWTNSPIVVIGGANMPMFKCPESFKPQTETKLEPGK
jgi:hypothetical protein